MSRKRTNGRLEHRASSGSIWQLGPFERRKENSPENGLFMIIAYGVVETLTIQ